MTATMKILNVSNHSMTDLQLSELKNLGYDLVELPEDVKKSWAQLSPNTYIHVCKKVYEVYEKENCQAMHVAGFPAAVSYICCNYDSIPLYYAYSERVSVEETKADGSVEKINRFMHKGFYRYRTW